MSSPLGTIAGLVWTSRDWWRAPSSGAETLTGVCGWASYCHTPRLNITRINHQNQTYLAGPFSGLQELSGVDTGPVAQEDICSLESDRLGVKSHSIS